MKNYLVNWFLVYKFFRIIKSEFKQFTPLMWAILLFILFGIFVRIWDLGYSNLQGDEINTLNFVKIQNLNLMDYLFSQKKGPVQFLINYVNISLFGYQNEFQVRFPYLFMGIAGIFTWYFLAKKIFDQKTALITALFISLNGLFISFSRITQYQSVMYFVMPLSIFAFIYALKTHKLVWYVLSGLLTGFLILTHYDGASILAFYGVAMFVLIKRSYFESYKISRRDYLGFAVMITSVLAINVAFYIPFFFGNSYYEDSTKGYLSSRLLGGGFMPRTEISLKLISMYVPNQWLIGLFLLSIIGIFSTHYKKFKFRNFSKYLNIFFIILCGLLIFSAWFSLYPIKPRSASGLFILASIGITVITSFFGQASWRKIGLTAWYLMSFSFYFFIVRDPRTHVYIAILPGLIFAAYGVYEIYKIIVAKYAILKHLLIVIFMLFFAFLSGFYWQIYLNKSPEYPWWDKTYFGQTIYHISENNRIDGVFGFNYDRGWNEIGEMYQKGCLTGSFESNEKDNLTYFYVGIKQKEGDSWSNENGADTMVIVEGPQSWTYVKRREFNGYKLLDKINKNGYDVAYIFGKNSVYPEGKLLCN